MYTSTNIHHAGFSLYPHLFILGQNVPNNFSSANNVVCGQRSSLATHSPRRSRTGLPCKRRVRYALYIECCCSGKALFVWVRIHPHVGPYWTACLYNSGLCHLPFRGKFSSIMERRSALRVGLRSYSRRASCVQAGRNWNGNANLCTSTNISQGAFVVSLLPSFAIVTL